MDIDQGFLSEAAKDIISIASLLVMIAIAFIGGIISHQYKKQEWNKEKYEILKNIVRSLIIIKAALQKARDLHKFTNENLTKINRYFDEILPDSEKYIGSSFRIRIGDVKSGIVDLFRCYLRPDVSEIEPDSAWEALVKKIDETKSEARKLSGLDSSWNEEEMDLRTFDELWRDLFTPRNTARKGNQSD